MSPAAAIMIWAISLLAAAGVVARPYRLPEAMWAAAGAVLLVALGLISPRDAALAILRGKDVYLFLLGMMLLSEIARREGLFDWIAAFAARAAGGSSRRLFLLMYAVGVVVTAVLSNDATAVVMTPAVFAVTRRARVDPLPFLLVCALVANSASFVLPISNPANLVVFDGGMPALQAWLSRFLLPSVLATVSTLFALRWAERERLGGRCESEIEMPQLSAGGKTAILGIAVATVMLLTVSALGIPLGAPTAAVGIATALVVFVRDRRSPWPALREITWSILPLVAGLFVLVEAVARTGLTTDLAEALQKVASTSPAGAAASAGGLIALASNLMNNLPAGLLASSTLAQSHVPQIVADCTLIGVDLGPNLSITGSLATILWLAVIRREGENVSFWRFLKIGVIAMPPALALAIAARLLSA